MSSNVGLSTPRGSGTSGYVQRNLSVLKPRATGYGQPYSLNDSARPPKIRKPDEDILRHDRLREIEVKVMELQDKLEDEGKLDDDEIEEECEKMRKTLAEEMEKGRGSSKKGGKTKSYQVHELAEAKARESEKLRRALGLRADHVKEGEESEHPMARQERRNREANVERARREEQDEEEKRGGDPGRDDDRRRRRYSDD